jgi:N utilization substance protein B
LPTPGKDSWSSGTANMTARRKARKRALDILYEADLRGLDAVGVLADRLKQADPPVSDYTVTLVEGADGHRERIDELLATYAEGWTLDRMPPVDRNLLRVAIFELLWCDDVPDPVAIDEAVELARTLSTDDSPRFVNGVLGKIQLVKSELG